jgi:ubiquinone/menaquinone biosynthesis C-methylase UbiE
VNCDRIARAYRWFEYAAFGRELERRRFRFLREVCGARRALILGDGDGRFLARLLANAPAVRVELVDSSKAMLELARQRAGSLRVSYKHGDARTVAFTRPGFDLVVTHFFLDCLDANDLRKLVDRVADAVQPGAVWLISEFRQPASGWRAGWAWVWLRTLYFFFGLTTGLEVRRLTDHRPLLKARGFCMEQVEEVWFGLLASEVWRKSTSSAP